MTNFASFTTGLIVGGLAMWYYCRKKGAQVAPASAVTTEPMSTSKEELEKAKACRMAVVDKAKEHADAEKKTEHLVRDYEGKNSCEDDMFSESVYEKAKAVVEATKQATKESKTVSDWVDSIDINDFKKGNTAKEEPAMDPRCVDINVYESTRDEFFNDPPEGWDCKTLVYYADCTLIDDGSEMEVDINETVGYGGLKLFNLLERGAERVIYLRNEKTKTIYEVFEDPYTYAEHLGINDE